MGTHPGGHSRPFLEELLSLTLDRRSRLRPVSTDGEGYLVRYRIEQRRRELRLLDGIIRSASILLEGIPGEFDEAADDLDGWLEQERHCGFPSMLENEAHRKVRDRVLHVLGRAA